MLIIERGKNGRTLLFFWNSTTLHTITNRARANEVDRMDLVGSVVDSDVVIVDDMIDTAGTLGKAADVLVANGGKSTYSPFCFHSDPFNCLTISILSHLSFHYSSSCLCICFTWSLFWPS